jgi:hypothetical protein
VRIEVSLEVFAATEFNEMYSVSGAVCASGLVLPTHRHKLKLGTEVVPETSEIFHILTRLSVRENVIDCILNVPQTTSNAY